MNVVPLASLAPAADPAAVQSAVRPQGIAPVAEIVAEIRAGRMVILVDEEDRENEGDLLMAAEHVTPEAINFMAKHARGLICLTLTRARCERLGLELMVRNNGSSHGTNFTVSIEAAEGVTTGISAADRARTVQAAVARDAKPSDIVQPGHVFPLMAQDGGVLMRAGHTEAGCDLARMAGCEPAAVICEVMRDDGTMARLPDLMQFAAQHGLKIGTIADLIAWRSATESLVRCVATRRMHTACGAFDARLYRDEPAGGLHLALTRGVISPEVETLARVHEPLSVLDLLETRASTHSWTVAAALERLAAHEGAAALVLLNAGESAQQLAAQFGALDSGLAPLQRRERSMDLRTYGIGAQILRDLGVRKMRLLGNPRKMPSMQGFALEVTGFEPPPAAAGVAGAACAS
jgi:3,4-dihydroxy 2-butanone 4-phosphate synthase/GTP cyclohydrolase II